MFRPTVDKNRVCVFCTVLLCVVWLAATLKRMQLFFLCLLASFPEKSKAGGRKTKKAGCDLAVSCCGTHLNTASSPLLNLLRGVGWFWGEGETRKETGSRGRGGKVFGFEATKDEESKH